jgi:NAD(P)H-flavin reductase
MEEFLEVEDFYTLQNETHIEVVSEFRKKGLEGTDAQVYWTNQMSDWYEDILMKAKKAYYDGVPIMSDKAFDKFEEYLRAIKPQSQVLKQVGSK